MLLTSDTASALIKPFLYGGIASLIAEFGTFPIDTAKTRLQVQGQISDEACRDVRYRGMIHTFIKVYKEEGLIALYNGLSPALLRQASYGTIKIGLYHLFKNQLTNYTNQQDEVFHMNIIAGVSSGAVAAAIANPTDVLKVRLQAATSFHYKQNIVRAFMTIYNTEGLRGLYRGVGPTSQRAGLVAGVLLPSYDLFKKIIIQSGALGDDFITHLIASFLAGVAGAVVTNPIDVIKSRMMNQSISSSHYYYSSSFDCFIKSIKSEGLMSLYRGFIPSYLRLGPWNIIFFITYEQLKRLLIF